MCVFLFRSPRVLKMTSEREKETRVDESKKKRRKDHFFSSFLCKQTQEGGNHLVFFSFLQNTNEKVEKLFVRLKIYMDVWI